MPRLKIFITARPDAVDEWMNHFGVVVGVIVILQDPLPCETLAQLLGVDMDEIIGTSSNLHSLLAPSEKDQAFRVHHKSFSDFMWP